MSKLKDRIIGAMLEALKECHDEADHILGTEADDPLEIARINAGAIKSRTGIVIRMVEKELSRLRQGEHYVDPEG